MKVGDFYSFYYLFREENYENTCIKITEILIKIHLAADER